MEKIKASRIQTNGFFKYLLVGNFIGFLILWLGFALLGAFSDNINLYVSGEPLTTAKTFLYAPLAAAMGAIPASIASWLSMTNVRRPFFPGKSTARRHVPYVWRWASRV